MRLEESVGVQAKNGEGVFWSDSPNEDLEIRLDLLLTILKMITLLVFCSSMLPFFEQSLAQVHIPNE